MNNPYDLGEPFKITDVYKILNNIPSVVDTKNVDISLASGIGYSAYQPSIDDLRTTDGRYLVPEVDSIFEIKLPTIDIIGEVT